MNERFETVAYNNKIMYLPTIIQLDSDTFYSVCIYIYIYCVVEHIIGRYIV